MLKSFPLVAILGCLAIISANGQLQNFTGVGFIACLKTEYEAAPCIDETTDFCLVSDSNCESQEIVSDEAEYVGWTLPCNCTTLNSCPASCLFQAVNNTGPTNGTSFRGPGYLSCPLTVSGEIESCVADIDPTCATVSACNLSAVGETAFDAETFYVNLECECIIANGCPSECEVIDEVPEPSVNVTAGRVDFNGSGLVTCPFEDYLQVPCEPIAPSNLSLCGGCDTVLTEDDVSYQPGDVDIVIPIPCKCMYMTDCPDTCTFSATEEGPMVTPAPSSAPTPLAIPIAAPTGSIIAPVPTIAEDDSNETVPVMASVPTPVVGGSPIQPPSPIASTSFATSPMYDRIGNIFTMQLVVVGTFILHAI
jgi:hypothetical protein